MQTRWLMCSLAGVLVGCQTPPEPVSAPPPLNVRIAPDLSAQSAVYTSRYVTERPAGANMADILGVPVEARLPVMRQNERQGRHGVFAVRQWRFTENPNLLR